MTGAPERGAAAGGPVFTRGQRAALLIAFALLTMLRLQQAWLHGRFYGEEGAVFLGFAWHRPAWTALWRPFGGYLNLAANASTLLLAHLLRAGLVPMEQAPRVTMVIALAFQVIPAALLLTGRAAWLADRRAVIACLAIVAASPMTEEVFANVLHIQYHLALAAGLILALDIPARRRTRRIYQVLLVLGPLCGPGAIVLLPMFALRTLVDRDRARAGQLAALAAGAAVQMLLFYTHNPARTQGVGLDVLANMLFTRLALLPYLSAPVALHGLALIEHLRESAGAGWWAATALAGAWFAGLAAFAVIGGLDASAWLILSGLLLAVLSFGPGMIAAAPKIRLYFWVAERYDFLPLALIGIGLVARAMRPDGRGRRLAAVLAGLQVVSGAVTFASPYFEIGAGPDWPAQVALWRRDHDHLLLVWAPDWLAIDLSDHDRPCRPVDAVEVPPSEPTYCESSWLRYTLRNSRLTTAPLKL